MQSSSLGYESNCYQHHLAIPKILLVKLKKTTEYYKGVISTQERKQSRVPCHCGLFFFVPTSVCKVRGKDSKHETKKKLKTN